MKKTLTHIANIKSGLFAKTISVGEIVFLQLKHFDDNGLLKESLIPDLKADHIAEKHLLKFGDVLFSAKGKKNFASCYINESIPAVASTSFFVIRLQDSFKKKILPEFLTWFINHPASQKYLKGNAIGTSMVSISKAVLGELEIAIPSIETQKTILKINNLYHKEKKLQLQIAMLREKEIQQQIIDSIK